MTWHTYLPRHLKTHGLSETKIKDMLLEARIKKPTKKCGKKCFFPQCKNTAPYGRLDIHLRKVHNYQNKNNKLRLS